MQLFSRWGASSNEDRSAKVSTELDVIGQLLRAWGENAFDIDLMDATTFSERCDAWARHVLTAAPAPLGRREPDGRRHYADLLGDMQRHRQQERQHVTQTMTGLKGAVWDVVTSLRETALANAREDERLQRQLVRLETLLAGDDVAAIRHVAAETARVVSDTIAARQQRDTLQLAALGTRMKSLESSLLEVRNLNRTDALTQLRNRGALDEDLPKLVMMASLAKDPLTVLMIDADRFKRINDTYGHPTGDVVLQALADALIRAFPRRSDYLARYGGEEFCVILRNTDRHAALRLAERFLNDLRSLDITHEETTLRITASIGIAELQEQESGADAIARADRALYTAKREGRDRALVASSS